MDKLSPFKCQLERLFVYYSSFADKENVTLLKIQNYRRLLTDMQLITPPPSTNLQASLASQCDVIFYSKAGATNFLTFYLFLDLLEPISLLFYSDSPLDKIIKFHIQPLHDHILKQTDFGKNIAIISPLLLREAAYMFLKIYEETLIVIYLHYFVKNGKEGESDELKIFMKCSR